MDPVGGSGASNTNEQSERTPGSRGIIIDSPPQHASSSPLASPSQVSDVDKRQIAGFTSPAGSPTSSVRRFSGLELGPGMCDMRGMDLGDCEPSSYRHQATGAPAMDMSLLESSELFAQWAQLMPDEALEYFQFDDLDSVPLDCLDAIGLPNQPQFTNRSHSGTPENSETVSSSGHSFGDREIMSDQKAITTCSDSACTSTVSSPGKRKWTRDGIEAARDDYDGVVPSTRQQHSIDTPPQQKHVTRGSRRPEKSTRYAIQTRSDVDIVDDGYRWRKYGQKPVKNSSHPRNYYRCTTPNCPVRKQVERCTENPRNVLTTYDGTHNHPGNPNHSARESIPPGNARGNAEDTLKSSAPGSAPITHLDGLLGPPRSPVPSNYIPPNLLDHMLTSALFEPGRWPNPAPPLPGASVSQRNIDLLRMHRFFMLQYQTQYPLLTDMFSLMRNYSLARPPLLDPSLALLAAQNYGAMRLRSQVNPESSSRPANSEIDQQASRSAPLSRSRQRLLRMQELMGERSSIDRRSQQAGEPAAERHEGVEKLVDLGDP